MKQKRINKSKKDIVSDIQLVQDAERRRALIRDIIFPYLSSLDENIAYSKLFIQSFAGIVEDVYEENRKRTTIGHISDRIEAKLKSVFKTSDPAQKKEFDRYMDLIGKIKDVSIQDLAYASELPRYIDGYMLQDSAKEKFNSIAIEKILG